MLNASTHRKDDLEMRQLLKASVRLLPSQDEVDLVYVAGLWPDAHLQVGHMGAKCIAPGRRVEAETGIEQRRSCADHLWTKSRYYREVHHAQLRGQSPCMDETGSP